MPFLLNKMLRSLILSKQFNNFTSKDTVKMGMSKKIADNMIIVGSKENLKMSKRRLRNKSNKSNKIPPKNTEKNNNLPMVKKNLFQYS